jgi:hypothetical protein
MPLSFRIGLVAAVAVLGGVRMRRSIRAAFRPEMKRSPHVFSWRRYYHLAITWGLAVFCVPFALAIAMPEQARSLSAALDKTCTGGPSVVATGATLDLEHVALTADEISALQQSYERRAAEAQAAYAETRRTHDSEVTTAWISLAGSCTLIAAVMAAASLFTRIRKPLAMAAVALLGICVSGTAIVLSARTATVLSGMLDAARTIGEYAGTKAVRADQAAWLVGPAVVIGQPSEIAECEPGFLYYRASDAAVPERPAPRAGFELGELSIEPAPEDQMHVVLPSARLGPQGRETMIREEETIMVLGFVDDGKMQARPGYPIVVSPADQRRVFDRLSQDLLGAPERRSLYAALLQVVFCAAAAWFITLLLASATEKIIGRFGGSGEDGASGEDTKHPSITQVLRYGGW